MNIFKIVFSNIKKRKGASVTFLIMVILAALMLSVSLTLIVVGNNFYDKKSLEFNSPNYSNFIIENSYKDEFMTFAEDYEDTADISLTDTLFGTGAWEMKSGTYDATAAMLKLNEVREKSFQKLEIIDEQAVKTKDMIVLSIGFRSNGFKSGEKIELNLNGKNYEFTIYGFFEDVMTGSSTIGLSTAYLDNEYFEELKDDGFFLSYKNISIRFDKPEECLDFKAAFNKEFNLNANETFVITYNMIKESSMIFISILSMVLIVFALIILIIAFIVARFSINNTIHEDVTTIGALKSIGYKNRVLRGSQILQYLMIAILGSIIGSLISIFSFGMIGNIIAGTSGLLWINSSSIIPIAISVITICSLAFIITFIITRKYKAITPINALRQGDSNHSFKKNALPLHKYKMPLNVHLGLKKGYKNFKNNITLFMVVSLLIFISSFVYTMSYNLNADKTAMIQMIGLEMSEIWVQPDPELDINEIDKLIKSHDEVNHTLFSGNSVATVDKIDSNVNCLEDFSQLTVNTVVKGRYPQLYNEIALGSVIAKETGKIPGDTVSVRINEIEKDYVIVGITQDIGNGGDYCSITKEAILKHNSKFNMDTIYVYLNDGIDTKNYIEKLKGIYENQIMTANTADQLDSILGSMSGSFAAISVVMVVITIIIIAAVLFLLISTLIRKEKTELGIMKAIGYKNSQLVMHILISMMLSLIIGTILGIILGFVVTNPLFSAVFSSMGLLSTYFIIPVLPIILIGFGIFVFSIGTMCLISLRLKKISPQRLIVE